MYKKQDKIAFNKWKKAKNILMENSEWCSMVI